MHFSVTAYDVSSFVWILLIPLKYETCILNTSKFHTEKNLNKYIKTKQTYNIDVRVNRSYKKMFNVVDFIEETELIKPVNLVFSILL